MEEVISQLVCDSLSPHLDSDVCDYITSMLSEEPFDEDTREAVGEMIRGSMMMEDDADETLLVTFFEALDLHKNGDDSNNNNDNNNSNNSNNSEDNTAPRLLSQAVTLKEKDVTTFASGLSAEHMADDITAEDGEDGGNTTKSGAGSSSIAQFYANMIDVSNNAAAQSERARRKDRQKVLRLEMEEKERKRALQDAMDMLGGDNGDEGEENKEDLLDNAANDNASSVHFKNLDLPNLRGGGPDLLQNVSLVLAKGRRYGLMGRNGCGKTTLLSFMATRQIPKAIPKNMSMLLVRQEIAGDANSAVETVLKSDVKRESVKKFIHWCETELDKLEHPEKYEEQDADTTTTNQEEKTEKPTKSRQKLRDRKRQNQQKAARNKVLSNNTNKTKTTMEEQKTRLSHKLATAYQRLGQIEEEEGGDPEPRARKVLAGLGFSKQMQDRPTKMLSGGWRMRVSLSCALFANPSLLLLDEPTNHLDLEAVLWLEKYLTDPSQFRGTLVVVSHDRHFLNEVVTDVVHFHRSKLTCYRGDVSTFEAVRDDDRLRQIRLRENQEAKKAHLQKYIDLHSQAGENGVKAARQRKSKMKKLEKVGVMAQEGKRWKASYDGDVEEVEEYVEDDTVKLTFPDPGAFDGDMVQLTRTSFGYTDDQPLLQDIDLSIDIKTRAALLGRNGCGKSTLIKLIVGALRPKKGQVKLNPHAKFEYLAQHQLEQLDPDGTPLHTLLERYPGDGSNTHILSLRRYLANFGLGGEVLPNQRIHTMSGGQKCRLCLASAMYSKPHLLILDEPTNHLDLETTQALIEAIQGFGGGVLLVSHDEHLLTSVCKHMYVLENGQLEELRGGSSSTSEAFQKYKKAVVLGRRDRKSVV